MFPKEYHQTPLHIVAGYGHNEICKQLLTLGVDVDCMDYVSYRATYTYTYTYIYVHTYANYIATYILATYIYITIINMFMHTKVATYICIYCVAPNFRGTIL